jgi:hypothetical protein
MNLSAVRSEPQPNLFAALRGRWLNFAAEQAEFIE